MCFPQLTLLSRRRLAAKTALSRVVDALFILLLHCCPSSAVLSRADKVYLRSCTFIHTPMYRGKRSCSVLSVSRSIPFLNRDAFINSITFLCDYCFISVLHPRTDVISRDVYPSLHGVLRRETTFPVLLCQLIYLPATMSCENPTVPLCSCSVAASRLLQVHTTYTYTCG